MFFETSLVSKLIQDCANKPKDEIPEWIVERVKKYLEHDMLVAVEKLFKIASQQKELNSDKWKDLNVTSWSREECIKSTMQTDGSSCGLWMLNFMEYWTGDILSDIPNQDNITQFRTKLAVILVDSELNDDNVRNQDDFELDERNTDPDDCVILESPAKRAKTSDPSSQFDFLSDFFPESPIINPTNDDLIELLCLQLEIIDPRLFEIEWVRISKPYPISLYKTNKEHIVHKLCGPRLLQCGCACTSEPPIKLM